MTSRPIRQLSYPSTGNSIPSSSKVYVGARTNFRKKAKKKMGWFKRKFAQWCREAWENTDKSHATDSAVSVSHDGINSNTSMRFTIYPASGGFVIEHYKQDRYKDNEGPSLTIVRNGESLGQAVEHILAIEALKA